MNLSHNGTAETAGTPDYWNMMISEDRAADFLGLRARTLQKWRVTGEGPRFFAISSRCIRYRRSDLKEFAESRGRFSTSEQEAA